MADTPPVRTRHTDPLMCQDCPLRDRAAFEEELVEKATNHWWRTINWAPIALLVTLFSGIILYSYRNDREITIQAGLEQARVNDAQWRAIQADHADILVLKEQVSEATKAMTTNSELILKNQEEIKRFLRSR